MKISRPRPDLGQVSGGRARSRDLAGGRLRQLPTVTQGDHAGGRPEADLAEGQPCTFDRVCDCGAVDEDAEGCGPA